jgi:hypothetical protein
MMLPKSDVFMLLRNDGPSMDERDKHWSMIMHGDDGSNRVRIQDDAASVPNFEATIMMQGCLDEIHKLPNHKIRPRLYMVMRHLILWVKPMYFRPRYFRDFLEAV